MLLSTATCATTSRADVTYHVFPAYPDGANPPEPRFWDLCMYLPSELEAMDVGYNASSSDGPGVDQLLHKLGAR